MASHRSASKGLLLTVFTERAGGLLARGKDTSSSIESLEYGTLLLLAALLDRLRFGTSTRLAGIFGSL